MIFYTSSGELLHKVLAISLSVFFEKVSFNVSLFSSAGLMTQSLGLTRDIIDMVMVMMGELPLMRLVYFSALLCGMCLCIVLFSLFLRGISIHLKDVQVGDQPPYFLSMSAVQMVGCDEMVLDTEV